MPLPWMKMSIGFRLDPKLESLSDAQHRVWYKLIVFAAEQRTRGLIRFDSEEILAIEVARGDVDLLRGTVSRLAQLGLVTTIDGAAPCNAEGVTPALHGALHGGSILFKNFEDESVTRNANVTRDRVRKCRENKRLKKTDNKNVTPLKRDVTHVTRVTPRGEGEEDKRREEVCSSTARAHTREGDQPKNSEMESSIAAVRAEFGDRYADMMDLMSQDIQSSLGGRWDCYVAALRATLRGKKPIDNTHLYTLKIAGSYAAHGIPPEPVPHVPEAPKPFRVADSIPEDFEIQFRPKHRRIS